MRMMQDGLEGVCCRGGSTNEERFFLVGELDTGSGREGTGTGS